MNKMFKAEVIGTLKYVVIVLVVLVVVVFVVRFVFLDDRTLSLL